jgi:hypothetical protein
MVVHMLPCCPYKEALEPVGVRWLFTCVLLVVLWMSGIVDSNARLLQLFCAAAGSHRSSS